MAGLLRLLKAQFNPPTDPTTSFAGKTVVLTGATAGLGYQAALKFLNLGVECLIIGSRDLERGEATKAELEQRTHRHHVIQVFELDMNTFQSVHDFVTRINNYVKRVDIVLLNAGLWNRVYTVSPEGWEESLQVNTLSTCLLAILLLPKLRSCSTPENPTHMTIVSSQQFVRVQAQAIQTESSMLRLLNDAGQFTGPKQYGASKLLLEFVIKTMAARLLNEDGTVPVIVNTVSPGLCASSLGRQYTKLHHRFVIWFLNKLFARTAEQGSRSLVSATYQGFESHGRCWRSDGYLDESTSLTTGVEGKKFQAKAWKEVLDVLNARSECLDSVVRDSVVRNA
ncbi:hypothetical protein BJX99DRAFT_217175 [Aspergillus californicus]